MLNLGPLVFASPAALIALAALPALWWLLRATPPAPKRVLFPALRFLIGLTAKQETPARTPWWLIALRLLICALVIVALARPVWNALPLPPGGGPVTLVIENGWAAGRNWQKTLENAQALVDAAERSGRPVVVAAAADGMADADQVSAKEARERLGALEPHPWNPDPDLAVAALSDAVHDGAVFWLTDGLNRDGRERTAATLGTYGSLSILAPAAEVLPMAIGMPERSSQSLRVPLMRATGDGDRGVVVVARDSDGRPLARTEATFTAGSREVETEIDLPSEILERIARLEIQGEETAAAVMLLDERWRRRPVGIHAGSDAAQPLLDAKHYARRALAPFAEVRTGSIDELLARPLSLMILTDTGLMDENAAVRLRAWVEDGGVLVRFSGPNLARMAAEGVEIPLLPVRLRPGTRNLGGALSWSKPAHFAPYPTDKPLAGLEVPEDVTVTTQVMAEPAIDLSAKTWARLEDGTPVVTGAKQGKGWTVLVHTATVPGWSNLSVSRVFVDMLRRFIGLGRGVSETAADEPLPPLDLLDGFGRGGAPHGDARPIPADARDVTPSAANPPGLYGSAESRRALNLAPTLSPLSPIPATVGTVAVRAYGAERERPLMPYLWAAVMILFLADMVIGLALRGLMPTRTATAAAILLMTAALIPRAEAAGDHDIRALEAANTTRLAYVVTGDSEIDEISRAGLWGLGVQVNRRTAVELGDPIGVDPAHDDLALFPLLYWPVTAGTALDALGADRLNEFMRNGGTILIDTRDGGTGESGAAMSDLGRMLDLPELQPVPQGHVLSRTFYLLERFQDRYPGRWAGGAVWIQARPDPSNDGVSPVIVGGHDWAAAWALNDSLMPMFPVASTGGAEQREQAIRFGVNLVMYALTGNYKADQVHAPAIMRRLSR